MQKRIVKTIFSLYMDKFNKMFVANFNSNIESPGNQCVT